VYKDKADVKLDSCSFGVLGELCTNLLHLSVSLV